MKVGIVGSRRRNIEEDKNILRQALIKLIENGYASSLVSGGCPKGADKFAEELAEELILPIKIFKPKFEEMKNQTRWEYARVCFERNTLIAMESDILIAVVALDRKGGTEDTIKKFKKFHGERKVLLL